MVKLKTMLVGLVVLGLALSSVCASARPAKEGSFLSNHAESVAEIISQIESNRLIALRYAKHFKTDPASVLIYMRNELSIVTLKETIELEVYFTNRSLNIVSERIELRSGTRVFANKAGVPVLQFGTGNPLAADLLKGAQPASGSPGGAPQTQDAASPRVTEVAGATEELLPAGSPIDTAAPAPTSTIDTVLPPSPADGMPGGLPPVPDLSGSLPQTSVPPAFEPGSISSWLIPIGAAGTGLALLSGRGGTSPGSPLVPPPITGPIDDDFVIPEPMSVTVLGGGALAMGWLARRRRRS